MRVLCPHCGQQTRENSLSCERCGTVVRRDGLSPECENHNGEKAVGCCVVCGCPVCGDCAMSVGERIFCSNHEHQRLYREWALIFRSRSEFEADAIVRNLHSAGIASRVFSMREFSEMFWFAESAIVRVMVRKEQEKEATDFLANLDLLHYSDSHPTE